MNAILFMEGVTFLNNDGIVVCEQTSLDVPLCHKIFEYLFWLSVDDVLHDLLPVFHIEHAELEECIHIEQRNDVIPIWLNQTSVDRMRSLNDGGEEIGNKFVHHIFG